MLAFCNWWFERCNHGVLEIGWINAITGGLTEFEQFERDDLNALVSSAVQANMVPGQACYIRAATVRAWNGTRGRTSDADFVQAPGLWSDIDKPEDFERARLVESPVKPNAQVITGTVPSMRVQSWVRASEPLVSGEMVRDLNVRLFKVYGGDPSVVNPSRLMRLAGSIAWPRKEGRVAEVVRFILPDPSLNRPRSYPVSMLQFSLPPADVDPTQKSPAGNGIDHGTNGEPFNFGFGASLSTVAAHVAAIKAGREWHNNVVRLVAHWVGQGRSSAEIMGHCEGWTLPGWTHAQTRAEVAKAIQGAREKWHVPDTDPVIGDAANPATGPATGKGLALLSLTELLALPPPVWLVHELLPEKSLVVPYGPPKSGKTFVILSMGLHIAAGLEWFGYPVTQGAVVYIAGEGTGGLSLRMRAMLSKYAVDPAVPFWTVRRAVNFRVASEINDLEAVIRKTVGDVPVRLLIVDTLSRAMPGADENSAQEVGAVIAAADYLKEALGCTVALVHHSGKDLERGARGTSALRGAWDAAFEIITKGQRTVVTVIDQKDGESGQVLVFKMEKVPVGLGRVSLVPMLDPDGSTDPDSGKRTMGGNAGLLLRVLRELLAGPVAEVLPPFEGAPTEMTRAVTTKRWRDAFYDKLPLNETEAKKKAFQRGSLKLMEVNLINMKEPWVWLCDVSDNRDGLPNDSLSGDRDTGSDDC